MFSPSSLPSRERGLKFFLIAALIDPLIVAPLAGARIEIGVYLVAVLYCVAPLAGARIEITTPL